MFVMICYDVPSKRTEIYKKMLKEYLVHEQASVFMGDLPESEVIKLNARIAERITSEDRVLKIIARNRHNIEVRRLSKESRGGQMRDEKDEWHGKDWTII